MCVCVSVSVCVCSTFPPHLANSFEGQEEVIQTLGIGGRGSAAVLGRTGVKREAQSDLEFCATACECSGTALID